VRQSAGAAWTRTTFENPERIAAISFANASNGWLVGMKDNELYKTANGGQTGAGLLPPFHRSNKPRGAAAGGAGWPLSSSGFTSRR